MASYFAREDSPSRGRSTSPRPRIPDDVSEGSLMDGLPDVPVPASPTPSVMLTPA
jgi:division protein 1